MMTRVLRWLARLAVVAGVVVAGLAALPHFSSVAALTAASPGISSHIADLPFDLDRLRSVFPVGPLLSAEAYFVDQRNNIALQAIRSRRRFDARQQTEIVGRQVFVLIVGEASRRDRWRLNGYARMTNPLLTHEQGLVSLSRMITPWTFTTASVPVILSRKKADDHSRLLTEGSIFALFREAGFDTYWISNQARAGGAGSPIGQISAEAAHSFWLNESANDVFGNSSHDEVVLPVLARVLARDEPKQFIVVHLMGSHDSYERRYPSRFNHFHPSLSDDPERTGSSPHDVRYLRNAYDNSIFYTDYVIAQLLDQLQQSGALAAAFYTSDHGESLLDGSCTARGHGGSAEEQYEVSALAWLSQRYQQQFPDTLAVLRAHAKAPLSTVNVFSSLADLAHIRYRGDDPSLSIFSAAFRPHPRVVNVRGRVVNFDTAPHLGACREP